MKNSLFALFLTVAAVPAQASLSLKEAFAAAKLNMETLRRADAVINQNKELKNQAVAAVLPTVSGVGAYTRIAPPDAAGASPFLLTRQYSAAIRLTQPLLRGGVVSGLELAQENLLLAKFQKDATEVSLYQLIINSYYNLAVAQMDLKNVKQLLLFSKERVDEIQERTRIGRSRRGELAQAKAQLHIAESQYQAASISLNEAQKSFRFLTGVEGAEININKEIPPLLEPLGEYLSKVKLRPDILAALQQAKVASKSVDVAKGGHYPQMDLVSNYYLDRTGILATSEWDVGVAVVIPIYQGGAVQSQVRQAVEARRIAELNGSETVRAAERDVSLIYQNIIHLQMQLKALQAALVKAEEAYKLNRKDYQYGLVTNLDVLQSLNVFIETKRTYDGLISIAQMNYKALQAAIGVLP